MYAKDLFVSSLAYSPKPAIFGVMAKKQPWLRMRVRGVDVTATGWRVRVKIPEIRIKVPTLKFELRSLAPSTQTVAATNALLLAASHTYAGPIWVMLLAVVGGSFVGAKSLKPPTAATCVGVCVGLSHAAITMNWVSLAALVPLALIGGFRDVRAARKGD